MRRGLLITCCLVQLIACKNKNSIPAGVLPKEKMQAVVWDLMRADQFLNNYVLNKDSSLNSKSESIKLYQQVFSIHGITKEEFRRSFTFYTTHPDLMKGIMDSLSNSVLINSPLPAEPGKTDSSKHKRRKNPLSVE